MDPQDAANSDATLGGCGPAASNDPNATTLGELAAAPAPATNVPKVVADAGGNVGAPSTNVPLDPNATTVGDDLDVLPAPPPVRAIVPGYELLGELGRGGMGVVYKARHIALNRLVALKMILSGDHAGGDELERFRSEGEAVARVQHPNLVQIFEVGEHEGRPYFALEYIEGGTLEQWRQERRREPAEAAHIVEILARAVHAVHQQGLIHRDLKPGNILMTATGEPKITDFGLAKKLDSGHGRTMTGEILGTPTYMAPEQATGRIKDIGAPTDIYALGTILYELLADRPPFRGDSGLEVMLMVTRTEPPPLSHFRAKLPHDLQTICLKCLEKQPSKRYATAADLAEDLRLFRAGEPIKARPLGALGRADKWARRHPARAALLAFAAFIMLVLAVSGTAYNIRLQGALDDAKTKGEESRQRLVRLNVAAGNRLLDEGDWFGALVYFAEALKLEDGVVAREEMHRLRLGSALKMCPDLKQMWFHDRAVRQINFSPDGLRVVTASEDGAARIWDVVTGQLVGKAMDHDGAVVHAEFSKDGRWFLTASLDGSARIWDAATGEPRVPPLKHGAPLRRAAFSPDGERVATCGANDHAILWSAVTGQPQPGRPTHSGEINAVAFSPDGQWLATAGNDNCACLWDTATAKKVFTFPHAKKVPWVDFQAQGKLLVTTCKDGTAQVWNVLTGAAQGQPLSHRLTIVHATFSADGQRVATASDDHTARVWDATTGKPLSPPLLHDSGVNMAVFDSSGNWLATAGDDNTMRLWCLSSFEEMRPVLSYNGSVPAVRFSPAGKLLLLSAGLDGLVRLTQTREGLASLMAARNAPLNLAKKTRPGSQTSAVSRDGTRILKANDDNSAGLYDAASGKALTPPLKHGSQVIHVAFSADEQRLVTSSDDNTARLWDAATGTLLTPPLRHRGTVVYAAFSPDGRLVVTASRDETARVWDATTGEPITPPLIHSTMVCVAAIGQDGLTIATTDAASRELTWKLHPDDRPVDEIVRHTQMLACAYLDPTRGYLPLDVSALREAWRQK